MGRHTSPSFLASVLHLLLLPSKAFRYAHLRHRTASQFSSCADGLSGSSTSFSFELTLDNGAVERVTLSCESDAEREAARIAAANPDAEATATNLAEVLKHQFRLIMPETFHGPKPKGGVLEGIVASVPVASTGLVLEVAQSTIEPGAGLGLFVRKHDATVDDVTLYGGQPLCGYGSGQMSDVPVEEGGKTIVFRLDSLACDVVFRDKLMPLKAALNSAAASKATSLDRAVKRTRQRVTLAAHRLTRNLTTGDVIGVSPDPDYDGPYRYFVPEDDMARRSCLTTAMSVGQWCNDLAVCFDAASGGLRVVPQKGRDVSFDTTEASYLAAADQYNLLVLTYRLNSLSDLLDQDKNSKSDCNNDVVVVPSAPLLTLSKSVTFRNVEPMELGCKYGFQYWQTQL